MSAADPPCPDCGASKVARQLSVFVHGGTAAARASADLVLRRRVLRRELWLLSLTR